MRWEEKECASLNLMDEIPTHGVAGKGALAAAMAGLQGGMVGVLWMLMWLGVSAVWQQDTFWRPENLFASAFYGGSAVRDGFATSTYAGLALYLLLYSVIGALFALAVRRWKRTATLPAAVLFGFAWYFVSYRWMWKSAIPAAYFLHSENPTMLGHLIYGTFLGRFPVYLEERPADTPAVPEAAEATPVPTQSSSPRDPVS